jgi:glutamate synthase domain-containing protein 2
MRCHTGSCIRGIATQKPELVARLDIEQTAQRVASFLESLAIELAAITLACGKRDVHELDRTDLVALTPQAAAITGLPYQGPSDYSAEPRHEKLTADS